MLEVTVNTTNDEARVIKWTIRIKLLPRRFVTVGRTRRFIRICQLTGVLSHLQYQHACTGERASSHGGRKDARRPELMLGKAVRLNYRRITPTALVARRPVEPTLPLSSRGVLPVVDDGGTQIDILQLRIRVPEDTQALAAEL